ncbi:MAG: substrate-binding domain-containing protein, partial [Armatimonadota bacterium]
SLKACLEPHGYGVMVMTSHDSRAGEVRATELLSQRKMDALIVAPCKGERDASRLDAIAETGTPVVMIDRWLPSRNCLSVATDNATGAELATRHLLELGHQRIGVVRARFACSSTRERLAGYRKALQSFGVKYDPDLVVSPNYNIGRDHYVEAGDLLSTLLSVPSPPTALFVFHDAIAVGVMSAAAKLHLRVPEDLSLVGYDDIEVVKYLPVPLTTIAQDKRALGQTAGDFVLRSLRGEAIAQRDVRLAPKLVVRQSTCRLAS